MPVFIERDDLHRDVASQRVLLELTEHAPAQHVWQEDVERDSARLVLLGEFKRIGAAHSHEHLEVLVARKIDQDARIVGIVLDDQQDGIARLNLVPVVRDLLDGALAEARSARRSPVLASLGVLAGRPRPRVRHR